MNYQDFLQTIIAYLKQSLGSEAVLSVEHITKNNGVTYEGLVIMRKGYNISPTIYMSQYYHRYVNGESVEMICNEILQIYREYLPKKEFDSGFFLNFSQMRSTIVPKLINYEKNTALLQNIPHRRFLDLAVVFQCLVDAGDHCQATILIRNDHIRLWGCDVQTLYPLALENALRLLPCRFENLIEYLKQHGDSEIDLSHPLPAPPESDESDLKMYLLTNRLRIAGASALLYPGLLRQISDYFGTNLMILPSSIHELLILPLSDDDCAGKELCVFPDMVRDVNRHHVEADEFLSDSPYLYLRSTQEILPVDQILEQGCPGFAEKNGQET